MVGMTAATDFNVSGIGFIATALLSAADFFWIPSVRLRQLLLAFGSLVVLGLVLPNASSYAVLGIILLSGYGMARVLQTRRAGWLLSGYLTILIAAFLALKQYPVLGWILPRAAQAPLQAFGLTVRDGALQHAVRITGLSYMFFRQIHVLVDASQGQIEDLSLWSYVNYQVNFFTILAGPIQRYQDFERQWRTLQPNLADPHELLRNCLRLLVGVLKLALIAPFFYKGWSELQGTLVHAQVFGWKYLAEFPSVLYFYPIYLYFNFSGYCDIVIAAGRFFGMEIPENFDEPWLARNAIDFWNRWHMTLGHWIRDYLFVPMYRPAVEFWPERALSLAPLFYFAAFVAAGIWHGTTFNFLVYGVWQGLGVSATKAYENWLLSRLGRQGLHEYMRSRGIRVVAILLNLHFQCVAMLIFSQRDVRDAFHLLRGLFFALAGR